MRRRKAATPALDHAAVDVAPIAVVDVELSAPLPDVAGATADGRRYVGASILVRLHGAPLGFLHLRTDGQGVTAAALADEIWLQLGDKVNRHLDADGLPGIDRLGPEGISSDGVPRCLSERADALRDAPSATVVVPTRNRPDELTRCLRSVQALEYPRYDVLVVDNSTGDATRRIVEDEFPEVGYVRVEGSGISRVRNRGVAEASGEILAFTDDDAVVDPGWLASLVAAFGRGERIACVTGLVVPLELETPAQVWFEEAGAYTEGCDERLIDLENRDRRSLLPYATGQIGAGVNMAWRATVLRGLGGFDVALDSPGAEDLAAFFDAIVGGFQIVYEPNAVVWHEHRRTYDELHRQLYWHGLGLGAYLTRCLVTQPRRIPDFVKRIPQGLSYGFTTSSPRNRTKSRDFPVGLTRAEQRGVVFGPLAYFRGVVRARRSASSGS